MKALEEILKQEPIYLNDWESKIDVISDFNGMYMSDSEYNAEITPHKNIEMWLEKKQQMKALIEQWKPINILFATYGCQEYEGSAWVLFERDGKLFEVNGSHCSCYGLEDQFEPEETRLEAIEYRLISGKMGNDYYSGNEFANELKQFLGIKP